MKDVAKLKDDAESEINKIISSVASRMGPQYEVSLDVYRMSSDLGKGQPYTDEYKVIIKSR
jgi:hypothetical protein